MCVAGFVINHVSRSALSESRGKRNILYEHLSLLLLPHQSERSDLGYRRNMRGRNDGQQQPGSHFNLKHVFWKVHQNKARKRKRELGASTSSWSERMNRATFVSRWRYKRREQSFQTGNKTRGHRGDVQLGKPSPRGRALQEIQLIGRFVTVASVQLTSATFSAVPKRYKWETEKTALALKPLRHKFSARYEKSAY